MIEIKEYYNDGSDCSGEAEIYTYNDLMYDIRFAQPWEKQLVKMALMILQRQCSLTS